MYFTSVTLIQFSLNKPPVSGKNRSVLELSVNFGSCGCIYHYPSWQCRVKSSSDSLHGLGEGACSCRTCSHMYAVKFPCPAQPQSCTSEFQNYRLTFRPRTPGRKWVRVEARYFLVQSVLGTWRIGIPDSGSLIPFYSHMPRLEYRIRTHWSPTGFRTNCSSSAYIIDQKHPVSFASGV